MFKLLEQLFSLLGRFDNHQTDLERFIISRNPVHAGEVDNLIREFTYGRSAV